MRSRYLTLQGVVCLHLMSTNHLYCSCIPRTPGTAVFRFFMSTTAPAIVFPDCFDDSTGADQDTNAVQVNISDSESAATRASRKRTRDASGDAASPSLTARGAPASRATASPVGPSVPSADDLAQLPQPSATDSARASPAAAAAAAAAASDSAQSTFARSISKDSSDSSDSESDSSDSDSDSDSDGDSSDSDADDVAAPVFPVRVLPASAIAPSAPAVSATTTATMSTAVVPSTASSVCGSCGGEARYSCPACRARSCSAACVQRHKASTGCSGRRAASTYVPLRSMDAATLEKDLAFLTAVTNAAGAAYRDARVAATSAAALPARLRHLLQHAALRGTPLQLSPAGMRDRERNASQYSPKDKLLFWTVELVFLSALCAEPSEDDFVPAHPRILSQSNSQAQAQTKLQVAMSGDGAAVRVRDTTTLADVPSAAKTSHRHSAADADGDGDDTANAKAESDGSQGPAAVRVVGGGSAAAVLATGVPRRPPKHAAFLLPVPAPECATWAECLDHMLLRAAPPLRAPTPPTGAGNGATAGAGNGGQQQQQGGKGKGKGKHQQQQQHKQHQQQQQHGNADNADNASQKQSVAVDIVALTAVPGSGSSDAVAFADASVDSDAKAAASRATESATGTVAETAVAIAAAVVPAETLAATVAVQSVCQAQQQHHGKARADAAALAAVVSPVAAPAVAATAAAASNSTDTNINKTSDTNIKNNGKNHAYANVGGAGGKYTRPRAPHGSSAGNTAAAAPVGGFVPGAPTAPLNNSTLRYLLAPYAKTHSRYRKAEAAAAATSAGAVATAGAGIVTAADAIESLTETATESASETATAVVAPTAGDSTPIEVDTATAGSSAAGVKATATASAPVAALRVFLRLRSAANDPLFAEFPLSATVGSSLRGAALSDFPRVYIALPDSEAQRYEGALAAVNDAALRPSEGAPPLREAPVQSFTPVSIVSSTGIAGEGDGEGAGAAQARGRGGRVGASGCKDDDDDDDDDDEGAEDVLAWVTQR